MQQQMQLQSWPRPFTFDDFVDLSMQAQRTEPGKRKSEDEVIAQMKKMAHGWRCRIHSLRPYVRAELLQELEKEHAIVARIVKEGKPYQHKVYGAAELILYREGFNALCKSVCAREVAETEKERQELEELKNRIS